MLDLGASEIVWGPLRVAFWVVLLSGVKPCGYSLPDVTAASVPRTKPQSGVCLMVLREHLHPCDSPLAYGSSCWGCCVSASPVLLSVALSFYLPLRKSCSSGFFSEQVAPYEAVAPAWASEEVA